MRVHRLFHFFDGRLQMPPDDELGDELSRVRPYDVGAQNF